MIGSPPLKVLVYFLHNPWPSRSGAHQRCLQVLRGLRTAGCEVIFASATSHTEQKWTQESEEALREITDGEVYVFNGPRRLGRLVDRVERKIRHWFSGESQLERTLSCPYSLIRWFRTLVERVNPDVIIVNYSWFDQLISHKAWRHRHRVIDTHDLVSLNQKLRSLAAAQIERCAKDGTASELREKFTSARSALSIDPEELEIFRRYDTVIAISRTEMAALGPLNSANIIYLPFVSEPSRFSKSSYAGPPLLSLGPNPFNIQGYLYFLDAVLPRIRSEVPGFKLVVTGVPGSVPRLAAEIDWRGFVKDRSAIFDHAGYSICPVFGGTGQQIKIVEAMAHGLAMVVFQEAAEASFVRHEENGFVARSAQEFAGYVVLLERDGKLRRRMGRAAMATIAEEHEKHEALPTLIQRLRSPQGPTECSLYARAESNAN